MEARYTQADLDEAVAAVVEDCAKVVLKYMATYPKGARTDICSLAHIAAKTVGMIRALKPNAQQILAKRDKRVKEEAEAQQRELTKHHHEIANRLVLDKEEAVREALEDSNNEMRKAIARITELDEKVRRALGGKEATSEPGG